MNFATHTDFGKFCDPSRLWKILRPIPTLNFATHPDFDGFCDPNRIWKILRLVFLLHLCEQIFPKLVRLVTSVGSQIKNDHPDLARDRDGGYPDPDEIPLEIEATILIPTESRPAF